MSINSTIESAGTAVDHKSAMDRMYRVQRHFYDATRAYYLLGRDRLIADLHPPAGGTVLEVGCGTGRNIVKAALEYPDAGFFGFDISDEMLATAAQSVGRHGLRSRVRLAQGDATDFQPYKAFRQNAFDRIYISFTLSMIPDWRKTLQSTLKMLKPEGELHIVDFGQCEGLPRLFKRGLFTWLNLFSVQPQKDLLDATRLIALQSGFDTELVSHCGGYAWLLKVKPHQNAS
jgi:S-adenosylmethionine-diacylgycerolhomoserine-N-methlytransferase